VENIYNSPTLLLWFCEAKSLLCRRSRHRVVPESCARAAAGNSFDRHPCAPPSTVFFDCLLRVHTARREKTASRPHHGRYPIL